MKLEEFSLIAFSGARLLGGEEPLFLVSFKLWEDYSDLFPTHLDQSKRISVYLAWHRSDLKDIKQTETPTCFHEVTSNVDHLLFQPNDEHSLFELFTDFRQPWSLSSTSASHCKEHPTIARLISQNRQERERERECRCSLRCRRRRRES